MVLMGSLPDRSNAPIAALILVPRHGTSNFCPARVKSRGTRNAKVRGSGYNLGETGPPIAQTRQEYEATLIQIATLHQHLLGKPGCGCLVDSRGARAARGFSMASGLAGHVWSVRELLTAIAV